MSLVLPSAWHLLCSMALTPKMQSFWCLSGTAKVLREVSPPSLGQHSLHLSVLHDLWYGHSLRNLVAAALCYISPCMSINIPASEFPSHSSTVPCQTHPSLLGSPAIRETTILPVWRQETCSSRTPEPMWVSPHVILFSQGSVLVACCPVTNNNCLLCCSVFQFTKGRQVQHRLPLCLSMPSTPLMLGTPDCSLGGLRIKHFEHIISVLDLNISRKLSNNLFLGNVFIFIATLWQEKCSLAIR